MITVSDFNILVRPGPEDDEGSDEEDGFFHRVPNKALRWEIFVGIKFQSSKPKDWGEFRAYGGSCKWVNGEVTDSVQIVDPERIKNYGGMLYTNCRKLLPKWDNAKRPTNVYGKDVVAADDLRIANDQHVCIFYKKPVPNVPRSDSAESRSKQRARYLDYEEDEGSAKAEGTTVQKNELWMYHPAIDTQDPDDLEEGGDIVKAWLGKYDIVMSDEPESGTVEGGQTVAYWHQAEFRVIKPKSHDIAWSHRLLLKISGNMAGLKREALLDGRPLTNQDDGSFTLPIAG